VTRVCRRRARAARWISASCAEASISVSRSIDSILVCFL
jgi:hypothetical protein